MTYGRFTPLHLQTGIAGQLGDVQHQGMGVLEFIFSETISASLGVRNDPLVLALQDFNIPQRTVGRSSIKFLNGNINYPTRPEPLGEISIKFRDFVTSSARAILQMWHAWVYNEPTGMMTPAPILKSTATLHLFNTIGGRERRATIFGLWPMKAPTVSINYGSGEVMVMDMTFSADWIQWDQTLYSTINLQTSDVPPQVNPWAIPSVP